MTRWSTAKARFWVGCPATTGRDSPRPAPITASCGAIPARSSCSWARNSASRREWDFNRALDWHLLDQPLHRGLRDCVRDLNRLYRRDPGASMRATAKPRASAGSCRTIGTSRSSPGCASAPPRIAPVAVISNFTPVPRHGYRIGLPAAGVWREIFNSDAPAYGGSGQGNLGRVTAPGFALARIPRLGRGHDSAAGDRHVPTRGRIEPMAASHSHDRAPCSSRHGLCARRRPRQPADGADRQARQARGLFRRQVADHRFRAVECAQFRHPPHRRRDAIQGPQPDPPSAARLELLPAGAQRELRHPAGEPARVGGALVSRHRRRRLPEYRHHRELRRRSYIVLLAGDHIYKMDYERMLQQHVDRRRRCDGRLHRGAARRRRPASASCMSTRTTASSPSWRSRPIRPACRASPERSLASMGIYVFEHELPVRATAPRRRRSQLEPRFRQGHHPPAGRRRPRPWRITSRAPAFAPRRKHPPIGAMSAPSMPISRPISTSPMWCPTSTSTTRTGRSGPMPR